MMMSREPKCAATSSTTVVMASALATSSVQAFAFPPLAVISFATVCVPSALISVTATLAPSAENLRAVAPPMPLAAPVMRTVRPFTERLSDLKSDDLKSDMALLAEIDAGHAAGLTRLAPIRRQVKQGRKTKKDRAMNELDFSRKQVLVVGGSSGIGNGIAQAFRAKGAQVHACGTRAKASDYSAEEGSHL